MNLSLFSSSTSKARRGNYSVMTAMAVVAILGMGAMTIDVSYMRLCNAQAQDVADAASQAALIALRQTGSETQAQAAAQAVVNANVIGGETPHLAEIDFGGWDDTADDPEFGEAGATPNAVSVRIERMDEEAVGTFLARLWDINSFEVAAHSVSATRSFQVILVMDITNSWSEKNFLHAREAALLSLDIMEESASGVDQVGMTMFTNRFSWEYTPLSMVADPGVAADVRDDWEKLNTASKAGYDKKHSDGKNCDLNSGSDKNDFEDPVEGGCYPDMPREYRDEPGTDHSVGMLQARQMFESSSSVSRYRAMIVMTDGQPNGLGSPGTAREDDGYEEERWNEYLGPAPRSGTDIRYASIAAAEDMWQDLAVNTWVVSFVADDWFMDHLPQGDGYYIRTSNPAELEPILAQIISEMPLAIVQ